MITTTNFNEYRLLDAGDGEKLESWNGIILRRPDPMAIWPKSVIGQWEKYDACYHRSHKGGGHWEYVKKMKEILDIPVIGNGDIKTVEQALAMLEYTKCDGIMIGRGAIGNPFLIKQLDDHLQGKDHAMPSYDERIQMCYDHAKRLCDLKGERIAMKQMRGLASWYIQGMPYSAKIKNACTHLSTYADLEKLFGDYLAEIHKHQSADQLDDATC